MSIPRVIECAKCTLAIPGPAEASAVFSYFDRNRAHLEPWEPERPPHFYSARFWENRLDASAEDALRESHARYFLLREGVPVAERVIGTCNFSNIVQGAFRACHLGYGLDASLVGQGYMYDALSHAVPVIMDALGLHRVMANYMPENARSAKVLHRCGFVIEGLAESYLHIGGRWRDHILTSFVREDPESESRPTT